MTAVRVIAWVRRRTGISPILAAFVAALVGLPVMLAYTLNHQTQAESLENARAISELMLQFRRYYNLQIVNRLQQGDHPVVVTENYKDIKGAIPIPATMSIELADLLGDRMANSPIRFAFVSDYPFKGRNRPAPDAFQREALEAFRADPERKEYWRDERASLDSYGLRFAIPVKMQKACVECHNAHPDSPFRFWRVGDTRGVQEVTLHRSFTKGRGADFLLVGGYLSVFVALLLLAIREYRRSNLSLQALNLEQARNTQTLERQRRQLIAQMDDLVTKTAVLDKAPFGILLADPRSEDLPILYANESLSRITGYGNEELIGRSFDLLQGPGTDRNAVDAIRRSVAEHRYIDIEVLSYRRDGKAFHNRLQLFPCTNADGQLVSYVGFVNDVTDLKRVEIEREQLAAELQESLKLQSLGLAIAGIAHDLNTPIGIALTASTHLAGAARMLEPGPDGAPPPAQLAKLKSTLERASELIGNNLRKAAGLVRSFKQTTVDANRVEWRSVALKPFFDSLLMSVSPLMERSHCEVRLDCPSDATLRTDPGSLSQVLTNLMVNASIHAFEGRDHRVIDIRVREQGPAIVVEVADNGNGMSKEALSQAFTPFFTTRRGAGGSGLGLFSSRRVVETTLGGKITVDSEPGRGTRFTIVLPVGGETDAARPVSHGA